MYLVTGAKFESENTRLMDKQRVKPVLLASWIALLDLRAVSRSFFYRHLISRQRLANGQSLEKSSPDYEALCHYDMINDEAAWILSEVL